MVIEQLRKEIKKHADPEKAEILQRFFKTGNGEYGEGDIFLGVMVPVQRKIAKEAAGRLSINDIQKLIDSNIHEERLIGLFVLIDKYKKADGEMKKEIFDFYLNNAEKINNWDLVDLSAPKIVGDFLLDKKEEGKEQSKKEQRKILYELAESDNLWKRRIAVLSCFAFIRENDFEDAFNISKILLKDNHDLIHKAVGWMLREIGKRDLDAEEEFLKENYKEMPRTMLRYAIEKFDEAKRLSYLKGEV